MKKVIVLFLILAMTLTGCAGFGKFSPGAQSVVDLICSPTPEQQAAATAMLAVLDMAQATGAVFFPVIGIFKASAVLTTIKNGGCFLLTELVEVFKAVDAANTAIVQVQLKKLKGAPTALPEYKPLRDLVK